MGDRPIESESKSVPEKGVSNAGIIKQVGDDLSRIFRHMLPGVLILGAAKASHPKWFCDVDKVTPWQYKLALLAAVAVVVGNTWYVLHRYTVHQFIDWLIYTFKRRPRSENIFGTGYVHWLTKHIDNSFQLLRKEEKLHNHLMFRSAQVIYMFIVAEVAIGFSFCAEGGSFFMIHRQPLCWGGVAVLIAAIFQYLLSNCADVDLAKLYGGGHKDRATTE